MKRFAHLLGALSLLACGGSTPPTPTPATPPPEAERPTGPVQALVDIAFEAFALESPFERGTFDQSESWLAVQRRGHATDPQAARLLDQLDNVADVLAAPRCHFSVAQLRQMELPSPDDPPPSHPPALHPFQSAAFTRAHTVSELAREMLIGLDTPEARCASTRVAAARAWAPVLAEVERRDGIEAAVAGSDALRGQVERLLEIEAEYAQRARSRAENGAEVAVALQREAVAILETWDPEPPGLDALRDYDFEAPIAAPDDRDSGTTYRELRALLTWAIHGAIRAAMPPVQRRSEASRILRSYVAALQSDPDEALRLSRSLPPDLPEPEPSRRGDEELRDPATLQRACGQPPASTADDEQREDDAYDEEEMALLAEERGPAFYACTATYTGRELGQLADRADEVDRTHPEDDASAPPPAGALATYLYERGCEAGDGHSCGQLGWILAEGPQDTRDPRRARDLLRRACEEEDVYGEVRWVACVRLANLLRTDRGGAPDPATAWRLLDPACQHARAGACTEMVEMLRDGERTLPPTEAQAVLEVACRNGSGLGCVHLGTERLASSPGDEAVEPALDAFVAACNVHGEREACVRLVRIALHWPRWYRLVSSFGGSLCYSDDGHAWCGWAAYRSDTSDRASWAERGCEAGSVDGCAAVALIAGPSGGARALRDACDGGSSLACFALAERARRRDPARARTLYERACSDDDDLAMGCAELSELLGTRRGGAPDAAAAAAARERACRIGRHPGTCTD